MTLKLISQSVGLKCKNKANGLVRRNHNSILAYPLVIDGDLIRLISVSCFRLYKKPFFCSKNWPRFHSSFIIFAVSVERGKINSLEISIVRRSERVAVPYAHSNKYARLCILPLKSKSVLFCLVVGYALTLKIDHPKKPLYFGLIFCSKEHSHLLNWAGAKKSGFSFSKK